MGDQLIQKLEKILEPYLGDDEILLLVKDIVDMNIMNMDIDDTNENEILSRIEALGKQYKKKIALDNISNQLEYLSNKLNSIESILKSEPTDKNLFSQLCVKFLGPITAKTKDDLAKARQFLGKIKTE